MPAHPFLRGASAVISLLAALLAASPLVAAGLRAGAAKSTITPDLKSAPVYMAGFGHNRVATSVHDDLYARCLALEAGDQTLVLCSVDLIGLFYEDVLKIRELLKAKAPPVTLLVVASSHVHEGPDTLGLWGPDPFHSGMDEKYMGWLDERIATTAERAVKDLRPSHMMLARDDHPLLALLQNDSRPPYVKDPYLFVMRLAGDEGQPIATLVNWSDHPETLGGKNTEITADYPHWLCDYVEGHGGGTAVFFEGSIGGLLSTLGDEGALLDPETGVTAHDDTWRKAELVGQTIGALAERTWRSGTPVNVTSIAVRRKVIFIPLVNDRFRIAGAANIYKGRKPLYTDGKLDPSTAEKEFMGLGKLKYSTGHDLQTEIDYIQLREGDRVAAEICTIPGEIYPELVNGGITRYPGADFPDAPFEPALREHLKSRYQFLFGLANDELGYIIPKGEWDDQPPWLQNRKERWYGEINSTGPETAGAVTRSLVELIEHTQ